MGLDTTHDCWHGPYSSFNQFRHELAKQIGIDLREYMGYGGNGLKDLQSIPHDIMPLLNHSDCDGELTPDECKKIANGLGEILNNLKIDKENEYLSSGSFRQHIIQFMNGCVNAAFMGEHVEFH